MINQTSQDLSPKTPSSKKTSLTLNVDDQREPVRNNDTDNDDVSLPPTPAVQPSWSFIASQPARPQAPTPDSGSNSEGTEITQQLEQTTISPDQTQIPSELTLDSGSKSESTEVTLQDEISTISSVQNQ